MDDELKGISLVVLGIVALLALVGLVLLFSNSTATGNVARAGYPDGLEWYGVRAARNYGSAPGYGIVEADYTVAPYRKGEAPAPQQYRQTMDTLQSNSRATERVIMDPSSPRYKYVSNWDE